MTPRFAKNNNVSRPCSELSVGVRAGHVLLFEELVQSGFHLVITSRFDGTARHVGGLVAGLFGAGFGIEDLSPGELALHQGPEFGVGLDFYHGVGDIFEGGGLGVLDEAHESDSAHVTRNVEERLGWVLGLQVSRRLVDCDEDVVDGARENARQIVVLICDLRDSDVAVSIPEAIGASDPVSELFANAGQERLVVQVTFRLGHDDLAHVELVEQTEDGGQISEGLVQSSRVRIGVLHESGLQRVEDGVARLVSDDVVRPAAVDDFLPVRIFEVEEEEAAMGAVVIGVRLLPGVRLHVDGARSPLPGQLRLDLEALQRASVHVQDAVNDRQRVDGVKLLRVANRVVQEVVVVVGRGHLRDVVVVEDANIAAARTLLNLLGDPRRAVANLNGGILFEDVHFAAQSRHCDVLEPVVFSGTSGFRLVGLGLLAPHCCGRVFVVVRVS